MLMALAMILSLLPATALAADVDSAAALQSALNAGGDVKLTESVTGNFVVPAGKAVTLDLNGNTITNDGDHTITVKYGGSLTVTGTGTVDNVTHAKAAVWNEGTVILNGGNYTRSKENGTSAEDAGGNSYYVLVNHGAMTVNSGVSVTQDGQFSSLLENGYYSYASGNPSSGYVEGTNAQYPQLTINGGVFTGGLNTIKNDDGGMLTINDGTFSNTSQAAFLNWNVATVNGGTFNSDGNCILNGGGNPEINQGDLTINGGSFTSEKDAIAAMNNNAGYLGGVAVAGGTFSSDVSAYVQPGMMQDSDGKIVIDTDTAVAEVNGVGYTSLSAALTAAQDGDTVTLLKSSTGNTKVKIQDGRKITLNMNGFDAGFIKNNNISIYHGGLDITGSGKLYEEEPYYAPVVIYGSNDPNARGYTTVTVGKDVTLEGWAGLFIDKLNANNGGTNAFGIEATVYGTLHSVKDTAGAGGHALYVQGTITATEGNVPRIVLDGATLKTELGNGMYLAGYAETTITDSVIDSSSEGSTGIELRAGKLTINGDTQVKGGTGGFTVDPNGNGSTTGNVAMAVVQHTTKLPTSVTINGGTFTGGAALFEQNAQKNEEEAVAKISVAVYGGTFQGTVYSQNKTDFIAGGTFSGDVSDQYIVPGMVQDESGKVVIDTATAVAEINGVGYTSLDAALAAAKDGDTIKLLKDLESSAAITIPAGVTLDGDGKTLTYIGGNVETPSNGAFLTAGGENVTIQNLTVETNNQIKHGVQFYSVKSGKLSGVTVNGGTYTSVIVNNSQNIILENCVLNSNGYTNIEYAVGSNIADMVIPSLTVDNVTFKPAGENGKPFMIWADKDTVGRIVTVLGGQTTEADAVAKIKENVTNKNPGDVVISVGLSGGSVGNETVSGVGYPSGSTSYAITVSKADNGTVTASRTRANKGLTVTLTVKADEGYKLDTITVTDKNGNEIKLTDKGDGKYTFTMPASAVTVKASFAKDDAPVETGLPFTDVKADDWFYEAVKYAYDNKLMDGTSSTTFAPLMTTNRAMIVTILWRLEGSPVVNYAMNFSDVESGVWYTEAVRWAAAEGIVKGYSDTVFAPDDTVTREQLATILYRYAEYKEYDVSAKDDLTTFADGSTVSTWAADGMTWAVGAQLITGKDGGKLDPTGTATRAEVATILMRFCENVAK